MPQATMILHATTVSVDGHGVLINGCSGAGKSALALQLIALGATLVADDRTLVVREGDVLIARPPDTIAGLIEARGVGLLRLPHLAAVPLALAVDLDRTETERLPEPHHMKVSEIMLPCLHNIASTHFAAAILLYLRGERITTP